MVQVLEDVTALDALCERVERVVKGDEHGRAAALTNVLHEAGQPAAAGGVLRALLSQPERMEEIARRSFLHRNGFFKLRLNTSADYALRLHVWTDQSAVQPEENVHDHRWSFASHMLCGSFRAKTYAMNDAGDQELYCYRYMRHAEQDQYHFVEAGRRRFVLMGDQIMGAGCTYYMDASVFHRLLYPPGMTTSTLVVTLPRSREWCYSCAERPREPEVEHEMGRLTVAQVEDCLQRVLACL